MEMIQSQISTSLYFLQVAQRLLPILLAAPFWVKTSCSTTIEAQQASMHLLYKKALLVNKDDLYDILDALFPFEKPLQRRRIPNTFITVPKRETETYPAKDEIHRLIPRSCMEPEVGTQSLKDLLRRLREAASTTQHNEIWQEELLGAVLLCIEVWKAIIYRQIETHEAGVAKVPSYVRSAQEATFDLEILIEQNVNGGRDGFGTCIADPLLFETFSPIKIDTVHDKHEGQAETILSSALLSDGLQPQFKRQEPTVLHSLSVSSHAEEKPDFLGEQDEVPAGAEKSRILCMEVPQWLPVWDESLETEVQDETVHELAAIQTALHDLRELAQELAMHTHTETERLEEAGTNLASTDCVTRRAVVDLAKASKTQASWWGVKGSSAGIISGSLLSIGLGPVGMIAGASIGGALGLAAGNSVRRRHTQKMERIVHDMSNPLPR